MLRVNRRAETNLHLVIGTHALECGLRSGEQWLQDSLVRVEIDAVMDAATPLSGVLDALLEAEARLQAVLQSRDLALATIQAVVADTWLDLLCLPWSNALLQSEQLAAYCRLQFLAQADVDTTQSLVRLDDAAYGAPRLAVAYPIVLMKALDQCADRLGGHLASVFPLSVAAWHLLPPSRQAAAAVLVSDADLLLTAIGAERLQQIHISLRETSSAVQPTEVTRHWQRVRLRDALAPQIAQPKFLDLSADQSLPADGGFTAVAYPWLANGPSRALQLAAVSRSSAYPLNAVQARKRMSMLQWGLLGLACAVLIAMGVQAWQTRQSVLSLQERITVHSPQLNTDSIERLPGRDELARIQSMNKAIWTLNLPVEQLLRAAQPAQRTVAVLSVDMNSAAMSNGGDGLIKVTAEAKSAQDMMRYVDGLGQHAPLIEAYLVSHEVAETQTEYPYRFTVEAKWRSS